MFCPIINTDIEMKPEIFFKHMHETNNDKSLSAAMDTLLPMYFKIATNLILFYCQDKEVFIVLITYIYILLYDV